MFDPKKLQLVRKASRDISLALAPALPSNDDGDATGQPRPVSVTMVGAQLPRVCAASLYAHELTAALTQAGLVCPLVAVNDPWSRHSYPPEVTFQFDANDLPSYRQAADAINLSGTDLVCVHHGNHIFGGDGGSYLHVMLRALRIPVVLILHDITSPPKAAVSGALAEIAHLADRIVVMSADDATIVHDTVQVPAAQIDVIPYGVMPPWPTQHGKRDLGLTDRPTLLTHALLSPKEGIERVIDAMPHILERHPRAVYLVLGTTDPEEKRLNGESYQVMLANRAQRLRVDASVVLLSHEPTGYGLASALAATDVYISPCADPERRSSTTLTQALGAGKAIVSTSYAFARSLLANENGVLVPWGANPTQALAAAISNILDNEDERRALESRALAQGTHSHWQGVLPLYQASFEQARQESSERRRRHFQVKTLADQPAGLPRLSLLHLETLSDSTGILHQANFAIPSYVGGYRTDDNARALLLLSLLQDGHTEDLIRARALRARYLAFLQYAFDSPSKRFRHSVSYARSFGPEFCSDESHGRVLWALGAAIGSGNAQDLTGPACDLFRASLAQLKHLTSARACGYALLGLNAYVSSFPSEQPARTTLTKLAETLMAMYAKSNTLAWPWFENTIEVDSAAIPQALIVSGARLHNKEMTDIGLRALRWLAATQFSRTTADRFTPQGFRQSDAPESPASAQLQRPTEACAAVQASIAAYESCGEVEWLDTARAAFNWFLGQNQAQRALYDDLTGGCADHMRAESVSPNQGAESTLAFLLALIEMRAAQRPPFGSPVSAVRPGRR